MAIEIRRRSLSEAETALIGAGLGRLLRGGDVLRLEGELGAGKTTLTRAVAAGMGVHTGGVASPTFVMVHEYPAASRGAGSGANPDLIHVDAYRLRGADELETLGWDRVVGEVLAGRAALLVEWPSRIAGRNQPLPGLDRGQDGSPREDALVEIVHAGERERELVFRLPEAWAGRAGIEDLEGRADTVCPVTGVRVPANSPTYPFSSDRARLADLHRWFSEHYRVGRDLTEADLDEDTTRGA